MGEVSALSRKLPNDLIKVGDSGIDIMRFEDFLATFDGQNPLNNNQLLKLILQSTAVDLMLKTLSQGYTCRVVNVTDAPTLIIEKNMYSRGYIIVNPSEVSGVSSINTIFASTSRVPATYNSSAFNVSGVDTARFIIDVTVQGAGATLVVHAQTQDPISGNWATSQNDIFSGNAAVGTYYASIGQLGVDNRLRLQAIVGVNAITFSIAGIFKGSGLPTGSTIFLGPSSVNTNMGYSLIAGAEKIIYIRKNTDLWGICTTGNSQLIKVWALQ